MKFIAIYLWLLILGVNQIIGQPIKKLGHVRDININYQVNGHDTLIEIKRCGNLKVFLQSDSSGHFLHFTGIYSNYLISGYYSFKESILDTLGDSVDPINASIKYYVVDHGSFKFVRNGIWIYYNLRSGKINFKQWYQNGKLIKHEGFIDKKLNKLFKCFHPSVRDVPQ